MQLPKFKSTKKTPKQYIDQNPIEALTSIGTGVVDSMKEDLGRPSVNDAWEQLLGAEVTKRADSGDLEPGAELNIFEIRKDVQTVTEMGRDFAREVVDAGKSRVEDTHEVQVKIQEILIEIKQLAKSTKEVQAEVEVISAESTQGKAGSYRVSFLEQMVNFLRDIRVDVEDSLAWFHALRSKKASRQYGVLAKKHGASFMLSHERSAVTQTG